METRVEAFNKHIAWWSEVNKETAWKLTREERDEACAASAWNAALAWAAARIGESHICCAGGAHNQAAIAALATLPAQTAQAVVKYTYAGPDLFIGNVQVRRWFGAICDQVRRWFGAIAGILLAGFLVVRIPAQTVKPALPPQHHLAPTPPRQGVQLPPAASTLSPKMIP